MAVDVEFVPLTLLLLLPRPATSGIFSCFSHKHVDTDIKLQHAVTTGRIPQTTIFSCLCDLFLLVHALVLAQTRGHGHHLSS